MEEPQTISDEALADGAPTPNSIHFVRTLQQITVTYSQMADQKASMLMAATFVVFTIAVGQARGGAMPVSLTVLALFAFASALCAMLAVLPSFGQKSEGWRNSGQRSSGQRNSGPSGAPNTIFFGVFARQDEDEWIERMMAALGDDPAYYRAMLRDIHQNGVVLERKKYRWLGRGYRIFLTGLCLTAVVFVLELGGAFGRP